MTVEVAQLFNHLAFTLVDDSDNLKLFSVDISGRNLKRLPMPTAASDPAWSPLLP